MTKDVRVKSLLTEILMKCRKEVQESMEERLQVEIGQIFSAEIESVEKHTGAGGTTYVVNGQMQTATGTFEGGIVAKFANDLDNEVQNAQALSKVLDQRQIEWDNQYETIPSNLRVFPRMIFAPQVIGTVKEANCLLLESIGKSHPLAKETEIKDRFEILGYVLGRLHGNKEINKVNLKLYEPMFRIMRETGKVIDESMKIWRKTLDVSQGGVTYLHGDSHQHNVLLVEKEGVRIADRIGLIDALMVPGDRMDDLGYGLSHIVQEELIKRVNHKQEPMDKSEINDFLEPFFRNFLYAIKTYLTTCTTEKGPLYSIIPIDFFLGAHLIIRSHLFPGIVAESLQKIGKYIVESAPMVALLET